MMSLECRKKNIRIVSNQNRCRRWFDLQSEFDNLSSFCPYETTHQSFRLRKTQKFHNKSQQQQQQQQQHEPTSRSQKLERPTHPHTTDADRIISGKNKVPN